MLFDGRTHARACHWPTVGQATMVTWSKQSSYCVRRHPTPSMSDRFEAAKIVPCYPVDDAKVTKWNILSENCSWSPPMMQDTKEVTIAEYAMAKSGQPREAQAAGARHETSVSACNFLHTASFKWLVAWALHKKLVPIQTNHTVANSLTY